MSISTFPGEKKRRKDTPIDHAERACQPNTPNQSYGLRSEYASLSSPLFPTKIHHRQENRSPRETHRSRRSPRYEPARLASMRPLAAPALCSHPHCPHNPLTEPRCSPGNTPCLPAVRTRPDAGSPGGSSSAPGSLIRGL